VFLVLIDLFVVDKKKSKKITLRHKYKVEKKVRAHHRQQRRDLRLHPQRNKKSKNQIQ
jgi:hypothetical protein